MIHQDQRPLTTHLQFDAKGCRISAIATLLIVIVVLLVLASWTTSRILVPAQTIQAQPSALSRRRIGVAVSNLLRNLREPETALPKN